MGYNFIFHGFKKQNINKTNPLKLTIHVIVTSKALDTSVSRLYNNYTFNEKHHFLLYISQQHIIIITSHTITLIHIVEQLHLMHFVSIPMDMNLRLVQQYN
jgi:hypothetical protein